MEISKLDPQEVFSIFAKLSRIPRGSGNTKAIGEYCVNFARERGYEASRDKIGNVLIRKDGQQGGENSPVLIVQGHLDMVCEKTADSMHDFEKDPLELLEENGFVRAKDTTLGADDGIAIAYALALLDSRDIPHPPLEILFTVDEETGMDGATALDMSVLKGNMLLNLDSEDEGILTVGCAGGFTFDVTQKITRSPSEGMELDLTIEGLHGGHSGVEIHKQLGNACKLAGRLLGSLQDEAKATLVSIDGGGKGNVIPSDCRMQVLVGSDCVESAEDIAEKTLCHWKRIYGECEENLRLKVQRKGAQKRMALSAEDTGRVADFINLCPNGVYEYSRHLKGQVETSDNLGIVKSDECEIHYQLLVRSLDEFKLEELKDQLMRLCRLLGDTVFTYQVTGSYPAWSYQEDSHIREVALASYRQLYHEEPIVEIIHAGLECGILQGKRKDLDCISLGPQMYDVHSFKERLDIASTQRTWELIKAILKGLLVL